MDLDLRETGSESGLAPIARLRPALADSDLVPQNVPDDPGRHLGRWRQGGLSVASQKENIRLEGLAFFGPEPVDNQPLPLANAILLAAQ